MRHTFCIILLLVIRLLLAETWIYEKTVVELPMGEEEGQLSVRLVPEGIEELDEGPTSFTVDEDENIYILTRRKNIIKKFDRNGNYICSSKYEGCAGDVIRFLGYHDGMVYTMSGDINNPCIRRYNENLEMIDFYPINTDNTNIYGLRFIENTRGEYGLLRNQNPQDIAFCRISLREQQYYLIGEDLFDDEYPKINLSGMWASNIGYSFLEYDKQHNLYIENHKGRLMRSELGIISWVGKFIQTDIEFDFGFNYGVNLIDRINPIISKHGTVYHLMVNSNYIEYVRWYRDGVE